MKTPITLKDWQGTEYSAGSRIVYVNGDSSGVSWRPGVVVDIVENPKYDPTHPYYAPQYFVMWKADKGLPWSKGEPKVTKLSNLSKIMVLQ